MPPALATFSPRRVGLILSGGGLRGFAHVGALAALANHGVVPDLVIGTSMGALVGTAWAAGVPLEAMVHRGVTVRRRDIFQLNHWGMAFERLRSPAIYRADPLRGLIGDFVPAGPLSALPRASWVNAVDIGHGSPVLFGAPEWAGVDAREAVYASCALPAFFPPAQISGRHFVDGGALDNLALHQAARAEVDLLIAIDVGTPNLAAEELGRSPKGFAATYLRSAMFLMQAVKMQHLEVWRGPPLLLVRPKIGHLGWFDFGAIRAFVDAGYAATHAALVATNGMAWESDRVYPQRRIAVAIDDSRCTRCGHCLAAAPRWFVRGADGRVVARQSERIVAEVLEPTLSSLCSAGAITLSSTGDGG